MVAGTAVGIGGGGVGDDNRVPRCSKITKNICSTTLCAAIPFTNIRGGPMISGGGGGGITLSQVGVSMGRECPDCQGVWGSAASSPSGVWGKPQLLFLGVCMGRSLSCFSYFCVYLA